MAYQSLTQGNTERAVILIVDDQQENLAVFTQLLTRNGFIVETAEDGIIALEMLETLSPDLILLDILMPGMSGFEVCYHLKRMPQISSVPVMFISAREDLQSRLKAFEAGGVDYITKPIQPVELIARVKAHIQLYRLQRQSDAFNDQLNETIAERTEQLNRLNERMATILASVTDAILLLDNRGYISNSNRGFDSMFGYQPDELFDYPLTHVITENDVEAVEQALIHINSGGQHVNLYVEGLRKDRSLFDVELSFSKVAHDDEHIVCTCHDITYLKETERVKDNFISMVTHELRTPITALSLITSTLVTHYDRMSEEQRRVRVGHLQTQSRVLRDLVESVLDITRLEARNVGYSAELVDIADVAKKVIAELSDLASEKEIALQFDILDTSEVVSGEAVDISRIWRNLISNAIKYTESGGQVTVNVGTVYVSDENEISLSFPVPLTLPPIAPGYYIVGQVNDTGHGIDAQDQAGLFTRFYRGWAKQSTIPGTGLGLSLVKELLDAYHGDITVESELGIGSTFTFWLPAQINAVEKDAQR